MVRALERIAQPDPSWDSDAVTGADLPRLDLLVTATVSWQRWRAAGGRAMYRNEQEQFWSGEFGDAYTARNSTAEKQAAATGRMARIVARTAAVRSVVEFGANVGSNLIALRILLPHARLEGVEINEEAYRRLATVGGVSAHHGSVLDYVQKPPADLAFTSGLLIHINPEELPRVYATLYQASARYIAVSEYYNPVPVEVSYRGHAHRLFKRDFAGDLLTAYPDLRLVDYGFMYHRDPVFPDDDATWFLLEKSVAQ
ncbi:MAG TPA: pseudaminic acid biosynthesis-associated methylase [Steroidobacteraceae bacterium]|nr:pseudaminic acid biosynthesis-associated methylase [Steroidobacteraceae bacterium]